MFSIVTGESLNALVPWFFRNLKEIKFPQDVESAQYFPIIIIAHTYISITFLCINRLYFHTDHGYFLYFLRFFFSTFFIAPTKILRFFWGVFLNAEITEAMCVIRPRLRPWSLLQN